MGFQISTRRGFFILLVHGYFVLSTGSDCCSKVTGICHDTCKQVMALMVDDFALRETKLDELKNYCPSRLVSFWNCMNETLDSLSNFGIWPGKECCDFALTEECLKACSESSSLSDVQSACKYDEESEFFTCLHYRQMEDNCCQNAESIDCYHSCRKIFKDSGNPSNNDQVIDTCSEISITVIRCVSNFTADVDTFNPYEYLHCCENAINSECAEICRRSLSIGMSEQDIVNHLQNNECGQQAFDGKCSLFDSNNLVESAIKESNNNYSRRNQIAAESAKLHCCLKAVSPVCQKLCMKIFSNEWFEASSTNFNFECLSYSTEEALNYCLDEVEEPCELGCEGLSYCTNFNDRPTELFRSCTGEADRAARDDFSLWQSQGYVSIFGGYQLPVRNISTCSPLMWKSLACILKIKPCHRLTHATSLCREDCYKLLSHCLDWSRIPEALTASMLCSRFAFHNPASPCISIESFLTPQENAMSNRQALLSTPCRNNPCKNDNHMCLVNRNCQQTVEASCTPYQCVPGCKLGAVSRYMVPEGTYVYLPVGAASLKGCYKVCQCTAGGQGVEKCHQMPCISLDACWIRGQKIEHGTKFHFDCNVCSCQAGEIICTNSQCELTAAGNEREEDVMISSYYYPCRCMPNYVPVCGRNGRTYSNACLAKCAGLIDEDYTFGTCVSKDVCDESVCGENEICVPDRKVCLSVLYKECSQYRCVNIQRSCKKMAHDPVCDTDGREHLNICHMYKYRRTLAYLGPCMVNCDRSAIVCGVDGNTYASECHAHANLINVDYKGPCVSVGIPLANSNHHQRCPQVLCPPLARSNCHQIIPPGACCPVCAATLQILFSQKQTDRFLHVLQQEKGVMNKLTVTAVLRSIQRHIRSIECVVRGYLTIDLQLFVLFIPSVANSPSQQQLNGCAHEAEKFAAMVRKSSPRITSELSLSIITMALNSHDATKRSTIVPSTQYENNGAAITTVRNSGRIFRDFIIVFVMTLSTVFM